jgi:hypothetical protein
MYTLTIRRVVLMTKSHGDIVASSVFGVIEKTIMIVLAKRAYIIVSGLTEYSRNYTLVNGERQVRKTDLSLI